MSKPVRLSPKPVPADTPASRPAKRVSLKTLFRAVFVDQLQLRRDGKQVKVGLGGGAAAATTRPGAAPPETPALAMHRGLARLLDGQPGSRAVLKHLAALEHHLRRRDTAFIRTLSPAAVQTMIRQLHGLIALPAPPEIQQLLLLLLDAADLQGRAEEQRAQAQAISSFFVDHKLEVHEISELPSELRSGFGPGTGTAG